MLGEYIAYAVKGVLLSYIPPTSDNDKKMGAVRTSYLPLSRPGTDGTTNHDGEDVEGNEEDEN